MIMLIILSQFNLNLNQQPIVVKDEGTPQSTQRASIINCTGTGVTCSQSGSTMTISSTATAPGAPADGGYVVWSSVGSSNERTLSAGNYTTIDTATPSQIQVDWAHGLTCSPGQAMTSGSTSTLACTSTITASDLSCSGCVSSAEIVSVTGAQVSSAVATATALAGDPADCSANQYATAINASGTLTCTQPAFSNISGTVSDGQLASSYSGVGACGANTWASTLNDNASPTCTQPGFSNLSGAATIAQGGTTETASTEDAVLVGAGTTDWVPAVLPACSDATTSKLLYNSSTNSFSCGTDQTGGVGSGTSFEQSVDLTDTGYFQTAVSLAATTATSKFVCQPFGTTADSLTPEVIAIAGLEITVSDLVAGVGLNLNVFNPRGLVGTVRIHCTTGG